MNTSIEFINHASVVIKGNGVSILSDPWFEGSAFHKGWDLLYETKNVQVKNILNRISHIWISHEHPDHFSVQFFKKYSQIIRDRSIKIIFQKTRDKRVLDFLKNLSLDCEELIFNRTKSLSKQFSVTCIKDGFYDSALLVECESEKILNLNDCVIDTPAKLRKLATKVGELDILLTQFSFAAWKGGKNNKKWRDDAAKEKLETIALQVEYLRPKIVVPFASFVYFSNSENSYLNDAINRPQNVCDRLKNKSTSVVVMKPHDILGGRINKTKTINATQFWNEKYDEIDHKVVNCYAGISEDTIRSSFISYCDRIAKKNSLRFIKAARLMSPISIFKPVTINVIDLNITVKFDYVTRCFCHTSDKPMLCMSSGSLNFLFTNSFGFDSLTVNGCFEEGYSGGFVNSTKTLAIENLNNLGIFVKISLLFRPSMIKLFLSRLHRVSRILNS